MSKRDFLGKFRNLFSKISPQVHVGGIQITDFAVRYAGVSRGGKFVKESLRLPPGVVVDGRVANRDALAAVLAELRLRVYPDLKKPLSAILTLPIRDVYLQTFSTPQVTEGDFEEAAELNAKMISPINSESAYYGWQRISEEVSASADVDMLGAFVQRQIVDDFIEVIEYAGFGIAAVEFGSMSLVRSVSKAGIAAKQKPHVILQVSVEGISLVVVRKELPHFHYFHAWSEIQDDGKTISMESFKETLKDELERVINFYLTHWSGEQIDNVVVITPTFEEEISGVIQGEFKNLKVNIVGPDEASAVLGAAWRGTVQRFTDEEISLAKISALGVFERQQLRNFTRIWRNIFAASMGFLLLLFLSSNIFVRAELNRLREDRSSVLSNPNIEEYQALVNEAGEFNALVNTLASIQQGSIHASGLLLELDSIAGPAIDFTKVEYNPSNSQVTLSGTAPSEEFAVSFKNRLEATPQFERVTLPLQNIFPEAPGVSFNLNFKVISFNFSE